MDADLSAVVDRLALRELVETYARAIDRRDAALLDSLFSDDAELLIHQDPDRGEPTSTLQGRDELGRITRAVERFVATTHFIGNHVVTLAPDGDDDHAAGETYCLAHHIYDDDSGARRNLVWSIRYEDRYVRDTRRWRFSQRRLLVDWQEDRPVTSGERLAT